MSVHVSMMEDGCLSVLRRSPQTQRNFVAVRESVMAQHRFGLHFQLTLCHKRNKDDSPLCSRKDQSCSSRAQRSSFKFCLSVQMQVANVLSTGNMYLCNLCVTESSAASFRCSSCVDAKYLPHSSSLLLQVVMHPMHVHTCICTSACNFK